MGAVFVIDGWPSPERHWETMLGVFLPCNWDSEDQQLVAHDPDDNSDIRSGVVIVHRSCFIEGHCPEETEEACALALAKALSDAADKHPLFYWIVISGDPQTEVAQYARLYFRKCGVPRGADTLFSACFRAFMRDPSDFSLLEPEPFDALFCLHLSWSADGDVRTELDAHETNLARTQFLRLAWRGDGDEPWRDAEIAWASQIDWNNLARSERARLRGAIGLALDRARP